MYSMQREENIREPMNLKPVYALNSFAAESRAIAGHDINTETQFCKSAGSLNSQPRAMAGRADPQHLFSPSVDVWGKIHLYGWHRSNRFFPSFSSSDHVSEEDTRAGNSLPQTSTACRREDFEIRRIKSASVPLHDESSVAQGLELTTRRKQPRPRVCDYDHLVTVVDKTLAVIQDIIKF
ncbi:hypothetical protein TNCV_3351971 [Trichonephila clavipes]|nr:hypothetical protein TNCV_3351971 [Trichonephila clavipes]